MVVMNANNGLIYYKFATRHRLAVERIIVTNSLQFLITIEQDRITCWRMEPVDSGVIYDRYMGAQCDEFDDNMTTDDPEYDDDDVYFDFQDALERALQVIFTVVPRDL